MKEPHKRITALSKQNHQAANDNAIWMTSTLSLSRNLEKFNFPVTLSTEGRKQIVSLVSGELLRSSHLQNPILLKSEECSPLDKEFLFENFLTSHSFHQAHSGEAFLLEEKGDFLAVINFPEHLGLMLNEPEGELEKALGRLIKIDVEVGKKLSYAYSPKFGFLTSNPAHCGTGFVVQLYLQLPALFHRNAIPTTTAKHKVEGVALTGLHGSPQEHVGDVLIVRNAFCLGVAEENALSTVRTFATNMLMEEKKLRNEIKQAHDPEILDKVSRALGLLNFSYQIEVVEALNAISLLKLGVDLGWVENVSIAQLNQLFFNCRRAHLLVQVGGEVRSEDLSHKRAEFLQSALRDVRLKT